MANLEQNLARLGEVQDQNSRTFLECAYVLEAQQWMIMRALETLAGTARIDWAQYEEQYKIFIETQEKALAEEKKLAEAPEDPDAGAVIFGG